MSIVWRMYALFSVALDLSTAAYVPTSVPEATKLFPAFVSPPWLSAVELTVQYGFSGQSVVLAQTASFAAPLPGAPSSNDPFLTRFTPPKAPYRTPRFNVPPRTSVPPQYVWFDFAAVNVPLPSLTNFTLPWIATPSLEVSASELTHRTPLFSDELVMEPLPERPATVSVHPFKSSVTPSATSRTSPYVSSAVSLRLSLSVLANSGSCIATIAASVNMYRLFPRWMSLGFILCYPFVTCCPLNRKTEAGKRKRTRRGDLKGRARRTCASKLSGRARL